MRWLHGKRADERGKPDLSEEVVAHFSGLQINLTSLVFAGHELKSKTAVRLQGCAAKSAWQSPPLQASPSLRREVIAIAATA